MNIQYYYQETKQNRQRIPRTKSIISSFTPTNKFADINVKQDKKTVKDLNTIRFYVTMYRK